MKRFPLVALALVAIAVDAQTINVSVAPADVDAQVSGAIVAFLPDGGCTLQVLGSGPVKGLNFATAPHRIGPVLCNAVTTAATRAAEIDIGLGTDAGTLVDGGAP